MGRYFKNISDKEVGLPPRKRHITFRLREDVGAMARQGRVAIACNGWTHSLERRIEPKVLASGRKRPGRSRLVTDLRDVTTGAREAEEEERIRAR